MSDYNYLLVTTRFVLLNWRM